MPLYWLCYRHNNQISVVIEPGASPFTLVCVLLLLICPRIAPRVRYSSNSAASVVIVRVKNMLLSSLVQLAAIGTSGICIFGIFWAGYLILNPPKKPDPERARTLRFFMATCIAIAIISAVASIFGTWYERKRIANAMAIVLKSKEAYQLEHPSPELERYIGMLKEFVRQMGEDPQRSQNQ
jgi:hypothetical protein